MFLVPASECICTSSDWRDCNDDCDACWGEECYFAAAWHRIKDAALEVYTEEGVRTWMASKNRHLDGRSPEDLLRSGQERRVLDYINFLAEGNFA